MTHWNFLTKLTLIGFMFVASSSLVAEDLNDFSPESFSKAYFTLKAEPQISESDLELFDDPVFFAEAEGCAEAVIRQPLPENPLDFTNVVLDKIIQIGEKVWSIVDRSRPVMNLKMPTVSAVPQGIQCWNHLEGWSAPMSRSYRVDYENLLGMNVISFEYKVIFSSGGSFNNQGQYLANVAVLPAEVNVFWGFSLNAEVQVGSVTNLGTRENPEAGVQLNVNWRVDTPFQANEMTDSYFVKGRGAILAL